VSDKNKHFRFELDRKLNPWLKFEPNFLTWLPNGESKTPQFIRCFPYYSIFSNRNQMSLFSRKAYDWLYVTHSVDFRCKKTSINKNYHQIGKVSIDTHVKMHLVWQRQITRWGIIRREISRYQREINVHLQLPCKIFVGRGNTLKNIGWGVLRFPNPYPIYD